MSSDTIKISRDCEAKLLSVRNELIEERDLILQALLACKPDDPKSCSAAVGRVLLAVKSKEEGLKELLDQVNSTSLPGNEFGAELRVLLSQRRSIVQLLLNPPPSTELMRTIAELPNIKKECVRLTKEIGMPALKMLEHSPPKLHKAEIEVLKKALIYFPNEIPKEVVSEYILSWARNFSPQTENDFSLCEQVREQLLKPTERSAFDLAVAKRLEKLARAVLNHTQLSLNRTEVYILQSALECSAAEVSLEEVEKYILAWAKEVKLSELEILQEAEKLLSAEAKIRLGRIVERKVRDKK